VAATRISCAQPHRRDAHRGRRRFSGHTRIGRYCRARYYHPGLQRFISEDPTGFAGGDGNLYAYVFNEPTNLRDPSGLEPITISTGAALAIVCAVGAAAGDVVVLTVSGRKTTWAELAGGAGIGCVGGVGVLAAYGAAAGAAAGKVSTGILVL
jgi:RHS repeat-associated protein